MESASQRSWWVYLLQGLLTVGFGLVAIVWPAITLFSFILLFGAFAVVNGVFRVAGSFVNRRESGWWPFSINVIAGLAGIAAGIIAFVWPGLTGLLLLFTIGAYALFTGVAALVGTIGSWSATTDRWLALFRGVVAIAFGVLAFTLPGVTALSLAWLIGLYAILFGISEIGFSFVVKRAQGDRSGE